MEEIKRTSDGNGAREALIKYISQNYIDGQYSERDTDRLLAWLWMEGYKVVPIE